MTPSVNLQLFSLQAAYKYAPAPAPTAWKPLRVLLLQGSLVDWGRPSRSPLRAPSRPRGAPHPPILFLVLPGVTGYRYACTGGQSIVSVPAPPITSCVAVHSSFFRPLIKALLFAPSGHELQASVGDCPHPTNECAAHPTSPNLATLWRDIASRFRCRARLRHEKKKKRAADDKLQHQLSTCFKTLSFSLKASIACSLSSPHHLCSSTLVLLLYLVLLSRQFVPALFASSSCCLALFSHHHHPPRIFFCPS